MKTLNPKSQIPNPKQILNPNFQNFKSRFWQKIFIISIITICILSLQFSSAETKTKKKKKETTATKIEAAKKEEKLKQAQEKINDTAWQVRLMRIGEGKKETYNDELCFVDNKFESKKMLKDGFSETNVTLSLKGENIVVWETMQTDAKGNLAFWKGEIEGEVMRGVLSLQPQKGAVKDYSFVSISKETISKEKVQEIKKQSQEISEEKPTEQKKEEKKKRWFW